MVGKMSGGGGKMFGGQNVVAPSVSGISLGGRCGFGRKRDMGVET